MKTESLRLLLLLALAVSPLSPAGASEMPTLAAEFALLDELALAYLHERAPTAVDGWEDAPEPVFFRAQHLRLGDPALRVPYGQSVFGERYRRLQAQTRASGLTPALRTAWHTYFSEWRAALRK